MPNPAAIINSASTSGVTANAAVTLLSNTPPAITQVSPASIPLGVFSLTVTGTGFTASSQASISGTALVTKFVSATQLTLYGFLSTPGAANLFVSNGPLASAPYPLPAGPANPQTTAGAARHFLQQAAFGPTAAEATNVRALGFQGWLNQQFAMPKVSNYSGLGSQGGMPSRFLTNAVNRPDQLRQRVAFALSQIFVTSLNKVI
jgi:hypothetical protein